MVVEDRRDWIDSGDFYETYERYKKEIEVEIERIGRLTDEPEDERDSSVSLTSIFTPTKYVMGTKGKMLRPFLTLLSCEAVGGRPRSVLKGAASIEIAHLASLVHDDIMDESDVRRGMLSVHKKFGANEALLVGDYLIFDAYAATLMLADFLPAERVVESLRNLSRCAMEIVKGQYMEYEKRGRLDLSIEDYVKIITLKTGMQFGGACQAGSILAGAPERLTDVLREYGVNLGIAFQIKDDILSIAGTTETIFKPPETDLTARLVTLPVILALSSNEPKLVERITRIYQRIGPIREEHQELYEILRECGAIQESMRICRDYANRALSHASELPPSGAKELLMGISMFIVERES